MKQTNPLLKISLVGLFLFFATIAAAQDPIPAVVPPVNAPEKLNTGTYDDGTGSVNSMTDAVLFYNPAGTSITLVASPDDGDGNSFDLYVWHEITAADGLVGDVIQTSDDPELILVDLEPGFHRIRVYGLVESGTGEDCSSSEFQDMVIFVLNPLAPSASTTSAITEFCIATPESGDLTFNTTLAFTRSYEHVNLPNPAVSAFDVTYNYFAMLEGDLTETRYPLQVTPATNNNGENTFTISYADIAALGVTGVLTFHVEVQYSESIKTRDGRSHAIWESEILNGSDEPYKIEITPQPGRPTITIKPGSITD